MPRHGRWSQRVRESSVSVTIGTGPRAAAAAPSQQVARSRSPEGAAMHETRRHRRNRRYRALQNSMADTRRGQVVFVSHCLLNQNTRYLGGAVSPGVVSAGIEAYVRDGTGIVQMPCPEQRVWGGVLKTRMLWLIQHPRIARAVPVAVAGGAAICPLALRTPGPRDRRGRRGLPSQRPVGTRHRRRRRVPQLRHTHNAGPETRSRSSGLPPPRTGNNRMDEHDRRPASPPARPRPVHSRADPRPGPPKRRGAVARGSAADPVIRHLVSRHACASAHDLAVPSILTLASGRARVHVPAWVRE